jgi:hypothetical protein
MTSSWLDFESPQAASRVDIAVATETTTTNLAPSIASVREQQTERMTDPEKARALPRQKARARPTRATRKVLALA